MSDKVLINADWKREGAFVGTEFRLQVGRYSCCPFLYDKVNEQQTLMPHVEYGLVCWVGEHGVQVKLAMNRTQLEEAAEYHRQATRLAKYANQFEYSPFRPSRYPHPLKPGVQLWSVTETNSRALAKPLLYQWHYKKGVEGVLTLLKDHPEIPSVKDLDLEQTLGLLEAHKLRPTDLRDKAGDQGRTFHKLAMFYLQGKNVDLTDAPQGHKDFLTGFAAWCTKVKLEPVAVEQMVYEDTEEAESIGGTLDCLAMVDRGFVESEWARLNQPKEQKEGTG